MTVKSLQMAVMVALLRFALTLVAAVAAPTAPASAASVALPVCPKPSLTDAVVLAGHSCRTWDSPPPATFDWIGVVEGDESMLLRALNLVHRKNDSYVALLFYASWCPFSKICRPNYQMLSSLFPSIRHFAFKESVIRPSILSRYGVHGFPTLFLLNSTIRVRYHGPRTINSLSAFYNNVTGINPASLDPMSVETMVGLSYDPELVDDALKENCPFSFARSLEKLFQQDTYLALASCFVLIKLLHFLLLKLTPSILRRWIRKIRCASLGNLWDCLQTRIEQVKCSFNRLYPCKRSSLQEGAMNARAWASKSLASVSLGEPSAGRSYTRNERR